MCGGLEELFAGSGWDLNWLRLLNVGFDDFDELSSHLSDACEHPFYPARALLYHFGITL